MTIDDVKQARHGDHLVRRVMTFEVKRLHDGSGGAAQVVPDYLRCSVVRTWDGISLRVLDAGDGSVRELGEHDLPCLSFERRTQAPEGHWLPEHFYGENT